MANANEIRNKLASYLARELDLDAFEDWVVQNTWDVRAQGSEEARELAHAIELRLSEFSSEHMDEESLRRELLPLVQKHYVAFGDPRISTGTSST